MQVLRGYQSRANEETLPEALKRIAAKVRRVVLAAPCGSGKSTQIADLCRRAVAKGKRALVVAHRRRLIKQLAERLAMFGVPFGVVMANLDDRQPWAIEDTAAPVQVASRDTLFARFGTAGIQPADLLIVDEAHVMSERFDALEDACGCCVVLGFTATPCRPDGSGLSRHYWHDLLTVTTIEDLLALAPPCLVPVDVYAPVGVAAKRRKGLKVSCSGDPVRQWLDHAEGLRTVTFCRTVAESIATRDAFRGVGVEARHLDASTPDDEREAAITALVAGDIHVITNVGVVGIGVDIPELECVQLLTKCVSPVALWQDLGRCQRPWEFKTRGVLLDHAAATAEHGMPNVSPAWGLSEHDSVQNRQQTKMANNPDARPVVCRSCGMVSAGTGVCPGCSTRLFGERPGNAPKIDREPLQLYDGAHPLPRKDPRQKKWEGTLYMAAAAGWTCGRAGAVFKNKVGVWPEAAGVSPVYDREQVGLTVAEVFPHFGRKKA